MKSVTFRILSRLYIKYIFRKEYNMIIKIDGKEIIVKDEEKNIVQIAEENGIIITAPCFRNKKKHGCCNACVIEVDSVQKYAYGTKPQDGMNIIYDRKDLDKLRKERLNEYVETIKSGKSTSSKSQSCNCSDSN